MQSRGGQYFRPLIIIWHVINVDITTKDIATGGSDAAEDITAAGCDITTKDIATGGSDP